MIQPLYPVNDSGPQKLDSSESLKMAKRIRFHCRNLDLCRVPDVTNYGSIEGTLVLVGEGQDDEQEICTIGHELFHKDFEIVYTAEDEDKPFLMTEGQGCSAVERVLSAMFQAGIITYNRF